MNTKRETAVKNIVTKALIVAGLLFVPVAARAGTDEDAELAKKTQNPVAALVSVPFQNNWDFGIGPADATRYTLNFQPIVPFSLGADANLIVRTIIPFIDAESPVEGGEDKTGFGDITQTFFFGPKDGIGGWTGAAGPVFLWPTAGQDALGCRKWGAGPSAVILRQQHGWTYGMLANHIWSYAGDDDRSDLSVTLLQPFFSYNTKTYTTLGMSSESTYDWEASQWTVPVNLSVSQLLKIGKLPIQVGVAGRYYADKSDGGPDWGLRFTMTFLFPK